MSTVILFPLSRTAAGRKLGAGGIPRNRHADPEGPRIVILPVVRIERHDDDPQDDLWPRTGRQGGGKVIYGPFGAEPDQPRPA